MGIRYYAYAFDGDRTDQALADPHAFVSDDPLADAWGCEPHASVAVATFVPRLPARDLLYLDKAWSDLQALAAGPPPRPAYRMFEGKVAWSRDGLSWNPWIRALDPAEVGFIAPDLAALTAELASDRLRRDDVHSEGDHLLQLLERAFSFVAELVRDGRGMVYLIG